MTSISVVIPNWNGARRLETLLPSLGQQTLQPAEVLVVDNGSEDDSLPVSLRNGARIVSFTSNRGFATAVNAGVAEARFELIAILNNDIRLEPNWLEVALHGLAGAPFAVGKLLRANDPTVLDGCFDAICRGACAWRCGASRADSPVWNESRDIQFPPFTALLIRREFFLTIGGLDERFESYMEDVEFGLRCASKRYTGRYVPAALAYHEGSGTLGGWHPKTVRQLSRNQIFLLAKHYDSATLVRCGWPIATAQLLWGLVALKNGAGLAWLAGKIEGVRRFGSFRRSTRDPDLLSVLGPSEREIRELQQLTGWEWYWRLYFALNW